MECQRPLKFLPFARHAGSPVSLPADVVFPEMLPPQGTGVAFEQRSPLQEIVSVNKPVLFEEPFTRI